MKTLVVYDTQFGNTEQVARTIANQLAAQGTMRLSTVGDAAGIDLSGIDLLVIGGPTQAHGPRQSLRDWVDAIPPTVLQRVAVATFDTRLRWPAFISGSAAHTAAKILRRHGARLVAPPASFFVEGREGPLAPGELERATAWAATLAAQVAEAAPAAGVAS